MIYVLGRGGHARVLSPMICMDHICVEPSDDIPSDAIVVIGIGNIAERKALYEKYKSRVLHLIHKTAVLAPGVKLGRGIQVMAGTIIQPGVIIGDNVIINTKASIDHDSVVGAHTHIAPGVTICGGVTIGKECFIGAGSVIVNNTTIPNRSFVKAGTVYKNNGN